MKAVDLSHRKGLHAFLILIQFVLVIQQMVMYFMFNKIVKTDYEKTPYLCVFVHTNKIKISTSEK